MAYQLGNAKVWSGTEWVDATGSLGPLEATGGTEITSGGYKYHVFTSSDDLTVIRAGLCDVFTVSGGGGGGKNDGSPQNVGGGGGGGDIKLSSNVYFGAGTISAVIGAGSTGGSGNVAPGGATYIGNIYSPGGGGAGSGSNGSGADGGDGACGGGGGNRYSNGGGVGITSGYSGGRGTTDQGAGGGAGFGQAGSNNSSTTGGAGGNGVNTYSSDWLSIVNPSLTDKLGEEVTSGVWWLCGGGGGGSRSNAVTSGGNGGGADGCTSANALARTGGGGGGHFNGTPGNGGSGFLIVRYEI